MRKHNGKTHLNSEHILYLIFHMCQYSSVFFGNSTKIKYEKVCISPNNISNGYKIIKQHVVIVFAYVYLHLYYSLSRKENIARTTSDKQFNI